VGFRNKKSGLFLIIIWILMMLATLSALNLPQATFNALPGSHVIASVDWAGYIVPSSFNGKKDIVSISGTWIVPHANASGGDGYSSTWIGIGGQDDKTLSQVGTEQNVYNKKVSYSAWYELLPAYSTQIQDIRVNPGDEISASITLIDSNVNQWSIQIVDLTTGQSYNQEFQYNSTRSSGEWVLERSTVNDQITNLADFNTVTFTGCKAQIGTQRGNIDNFTYSVVQMANQQYQRLATASQLGADGASFNVTYQKTS
jgi:hypothetical protein